MIPLPRQSPEALSPAHIAALRAFWVGPGRAGSPERLTSFLAGVGLGQRLGYEQGYLAAVEQLGTREVGD